MKEAEGQFYFSLGLHKKGPKMVFAQTFSQLECQEKWLQLHRHNGTMASRGFLKIRLSSSVAWSSPEKRGFLAFAVSFHQCPASVGSLGTSLWFSFSITKLLSGQALELAR